MMSHQVYLSRYQTDACEHPSLSHSDSLGRWVGLGCWVICTVITNHLGQVCKIVHPPLVMSCHPSYILYKLLARSCARATAFIIFCSTTSNRTRSLHPHIPTPTRTPNTQARAIQNLTNPVRNVWRTYGARSPSPKPETRTKSKSRIGLCTHLCPSSPSMPSPVQHKPHPTPSSRTIVPYRDPDRSPPHPLSLQSLLPVRARRNPSTENPNPLPTEDGTACADWCPGCGW